jgi:hypothetical protein
MSEFLDRYTQAEKKGAEDSCLPINIIDLVLFYFVFFKVYIPTIKYIRTDVKNTFSNN